MRTIVITHQDILPNEFEAINALFDAGLEILHFRKPDLNLSETAHFLEIFLPQHLSKIVLHDHYELADSFEVKGIHLNMRNNANKKLDEKYISCSCHSLVEVAEKKQDFDYVFLSPIFDSISKQGYSSAFTANQLTEAALLKVIDEKVIAIGGITPENIPQLLQWNFGGYAVLGYLWKPFIHDSNINKLVERFLKYVNYG